MLQLKALLDADLDAASRTGEQALNDERLPFTLRVAGTQDDLWKAVQIRHSAYARHLPDFAATLARPEPTDFEDGVAVLLAESKMDGAPLGTMRIETNRYRPLALERSLELPDWLQGRPLAEAVRLGVTEERIGRVVKTALFKAYFLYCAAQGVDWMVIAGRSPIDRQYERLMFRDVYPGQGFIPLRHAAGMPHRVMAMQVSQAEPMWREARHPLYDYVFRTRHEDISIAATRQATLAEPAWASGRTASTMSRHQ
ncbi:hypothetical protein [Noviherbaspirillum aridicola]|uniref:N-acyl amino acid synthase of PEP-CTERM/exosortase system n=1 Tax=Noviherbaspirillum aridicola TaxID=2849687 RepID=A0ABQ4Q0I9_9BURK|nr:hypothetical protein [Noviherbaspirillum aridicola]GIZ50546.1 hypothetical protein NCCP691_05600 [Noviherbaspirillum aridicola]